jgi:putative ABC transport system permease protein
MALAPAAGPVCSFLPDAGTRTHPPVLADLRSAVRQLRRARGFTAVAVLTLALGVGAATALLTAVDAVLLRPLPYRDPDRLAFVREYGTGGAPGDVQSSLRSVSEWRGRTRAFGALAAYRYWLFNLAGAPQAEALLGAYVTDNAFATLGVPPALGRTFRPGDDRPGANRVAVLSHDLWRRRFGADPGVLGRALRMDGAAYTVVGVMPAGFDFPATVPANAALPSRALDVWVPAGVDPLRVGRGEHTWWVVGRLAPGATPARAEDELSRFARAAHAADPEAYDAVAVRALRAHVVAPVRPALLLLLGAVGVLLAIACANVAGLLLARATGRAREVAVRLAVGATRGRIVRQLLAESAVLAAAGAALGLGLAAGAVAGLAHVAPANVPRLAAAHVDARALAFAAAAALVTALAFGLAPALHAARGGAGGGGGGLTDTLRAAGRGATAGRAAARGRSALVVAQVALSLLLLAGAGLLARSYRALAAERLGFEPARLLTLVTLLPEGRYPDVRARSAFVSQAVARVAALPAVASAAAVSTLPLSGLGSNGSAAVEGRPAPRPEDRLNVNTRTATPGYFRALGIPLVAGRDVAAGDTLGAPPVVVVSRALAAHLFPGESPLGRRLTSVRERPLEIVGVVGDVRDDALDRAPRPTVYMPTAQDADVVVGFALRTRGGPRAAEGAVRAALAGLDPEQPVTNVRPMADYVSQATEARRFGLALTGAFAGVALGLSAVGLYGVLAYLAGLRARELAVRAALGATRSDAARLVAGGALRLTALGVALGAAAALALRRAVAAQLYGVGAADPVTLGAVAAVLAGAALAASAAPALRAARVDPAAALRAE